MTTTSASLLLVLALVACGGSSEPQPGLPVEAKDWPETTTTTSAWPYFGSGNTGVVVAPRWVEPQQLGCEQRVLTRTEPQRDFLPGDGPRTIYGEKLDSVCKPLGTSLVVIDGPRYAEASLFSGDCITGVRLATVGATLAELRFATPAACTELTAMRASSSSGARRIRTTIRLVALEPSPVFELVKVEVADPSATFAITEE